MVGFDVLVFSSLYEGLPMTLLEGMASRRCIVATKAPGLAEVLTDGKEPCSRPTRSRRARGSLCRAIGTADLRRRLGDAAHGRSSPATPWIGWFRSTKRCTERSWVRDGRHDRRLPFHQAARREPSPRSFRGLCALGANRRRRPGQRTSCCRGPAGHCPGRGPSATARKPGPHRVVHALAGTGRSFPSRIAIPSLARHGGHPARRPPPCRGRGSCSSCSSRRCSRRSTGLPADLRATKCATTTRPRRPTRLRRARETCVGHQRMLLRATSSSPSPTAWSTDIKPIRSDVQIEFPSASSVRSSFLPTDPARTSPGLRVIPGPRDRAASVTSTIGPIGNCLSSSLLGRRGWNSSSSARCITCTGYAGGRRAAEAPSQRTLFCPAVDQADIPANIAGLDVCLIPYRINDAVERINPLKLYQYLAAGKPVVSTAIPSVKPFADIVAGRRRGTVPARDRARSRDIRRSSAARRAPAGGPAIHVGRRRGASAGDFPQRAGPTPRRLKRRRPRRMNPAWPSLLRALGLGQGRTTVGAIAGVVAVVRPPALVQLSRDTAN